MFPEEINVNCFIPGGKEAIMADPGKPVRYCMIKEFKYDSDFINIYPAGSFPSTLSIFKLIN